MARLGQGWDEPLILWLALVGGPATGKSAALATVRRALAAVEKTAGREGRGPLVVDTPTPLPALLSAAAKRPAGALLWRDEPGAGFRRWAATAAARRSTRARCSPPSRRCARRWAEAARP